MRNSVVTLDKMKAPRARPNAFIVNDSIYVMSATNSKSSQLSGEKYILKENKWKDFEAKNVPLLGHGSKSKSWMINNGPAALLYEWDVLYIECKIKRLIIQKLKIQVLIMLV